MRLFAVAPAAASVRVHAAAAASQHCIPSGQSVGAQADAAPAAQEVHHLAPQKPKTSAKARVHVAIDDRIVAAVGHGQPVACEPDVRQRPPLGDVVVVQLELNSAAKRGHKNKWCLYELYRRLQFSILLALIPQIDSWLLTI